MRIFHKFRIEHENTNYFWNHLCLSGVISFSGHHAQPSYIVRYWHNPSRSLQIRRARLTFIDNLFYGPLVAQEPFLTVVSNGSPPIFRAEKTLVVRSCVCSLLRFVAIFLDVKWDVEDNFQLLASVLEPHNLSNFSANFRKRCMVIVHCHSSWAMSGLLNSCTQPSVPI